MSNWYTFLHTKQQAEKVKGQIGLLPFILGSLILIIAGLWFILFLLNSSGIYLFDNRTKDDDLSYLSCFNPSVQHWEDEITSWAQEWGLDPLLIAAVMQIESCGNPQAVSNASAQGLFQVMPYHFLAGDDMLDPETNAQRGLAYLSQSYEKAGGDIERTLAGYNGGHGQITRDPCLWPEETQRYVLFGTAIYQEATNNNRQNNAINTWLDSGGENLCLQAEIELGLN